MVGEISFVKIPAANNGKAPALAELQDNVAMHSLSNSVESSDSNFSSRESLLLFLELAILKVPELCRASVAPSSNAGW